MAFEIDQRHNAGKQVRRAADSQLKKALHVLRRPSSGGRAQDGAVHNGRKRLKEVRALLRLVKGALSKRGFHRDNRELRDAARPLSALRDATALVEALAGLREYYRREVKPRAFDAAASALGRHRRELRAKVVVRNRALSNAAKTVARVRKRVSRWKLPAHAWPVLHAGLSRSYGKSRAAMAAAIEKHSDARWHEWRKRTKDMRYQLELLGPLWPAVLKNVAEEAHRLTTLLGDDHDLALLGELVEGALADEVPAEEAKALQALAAQRRGELQAAARALGRRLFAETPGAFVDRIRSYWKAEAEEEAK